VETNYEMLEVLSFCDGERVLRMLLNRGAGNAGAGGTELENVNKLQRIGNIVTDRARVQVRFCSHFSFSNFPCSFSAPRSPFLQ